MARESSSRQVYRCSTNVGAPRRRVFTTGLLAALVALLWLMLASSSAHAVRSEPSSERQLRSTDARSTLESTRAAAGPSATLPVTTTTSPTQVQIDELHHEVDSTRQLLVLAVIPISLILGVGGVVSVVFSVRDQRRVSQLHELSVSAETSSQRRTEESYAMFLDASQKTLTLVNDTLALAKESSERAASTMQLKAKRALTGIEQQAADLLDEIGDDMKVVVTNAQVRTHLQHVATELGAIEGYLMLQDIDITPGCLWIKGMNLHLEDDPRGARTSLRKAAQDAEHRDLRVLALYWLGYLQNNAGHYNDAGRMFREARADVQPDTPRAAEIDRIALESDYFEIANESTLEPEQSSERMQAVAIVLDRLHHLAASLPTGDRAYESVSRYIASTRGNVLTWAAGLNRSRSAVAADPTARDALQAALSYYQDAGGTKDRLWPLFGSAESDFYLTGVVAREAYHKLEQLIVDEQRTRSEPRNAANLNQAILIVRLRLSDGRASEPVRDAYSRVQAALSGVGETITIFSQLQKRNLTRDGFQAEVAKLLSTAQEADRQAAETPAPPPASEGGDQTDEAGSGQTNDA